MEKDRIYFERRAAEERVAAMKAVHRAQQAHLELANRYDELAQMVSARAEIVSP